MAYIELHQEFRDHPKVLRLSVNLGIDFCLCQAILINLWLWAVSYARDGNLSGFSENEIGKACKSNLDPKKLLKALIETRFLDKKGEKLLLHDWKKYGLRILNSSRQRTAKSRKVKKLETYDVTLLQRDGNAYLSILSILSIPSNNIIRSERFLTAWEEWLEFRWKEKKKPVTELSAKQQLKMLAAQRDPVAVIEKSIANGWQGLFPLKDEPRRVNETPVQRGPRTGQPVPLASVIGCPDHPGIKQGPDKMCLGCFPLCPKCKHQHRADESCEEVETRMKDMKKAFGYGR